MGLLLTKRLGTGMEPQRGTPDDRDAGTYGQRVRIPDQGGDELYRPGPDREPVVAACVQPEDERDDG